ncbi:hypothetical protein PGTUg99_025501 [Puccinia graminis f. sp. tritici]|uniref:Uncharacterized protein n=1 Tax=Puccinia graminis f. sp. tritici TaxID=56615 RepID=A0A5B0MC02_PUCGR|nr:hypothetical protein PGTUg99_025501 [Puccinia graminis f. sp. tritici]
MEYERPQAGGSPNLNLNSTSISLKHYPASTGSSSAVVDLHCMPPLAACSVGAPRRKAGGVTAFLAELAPTVTSIEAAESFEPLTHSLSTLHTDCSILIGPRYSRYGWQADEN